MWVGALRHWLVWMPRIVGSTGGVGISSLAGVDDGGCRLKGEVGISSLAGVDAGGCRLKGEVGISSLAGVDAGGCKLKRGVGILSLAGVDAGGWEPTLGGWTAGEEAPIVIIHGPSYQITSSFSCKYMVCFHNTGCLFEMPNTPIATATIRRLAKEQKKRYIIHNSRYCTTTSLPSCFSRWNNPHISSAIALLDIPALSSSTDGKSRKQPSMTVFAATPWAITHRVL